MLNLASTSDLLKVTTGSAGTIEVHATWVELLTTTGAVTPGRTNTADITGTGATTVVGSPSSSTIRNVKLLSVRNSHASVSNAITVSHTDGTTEHILWKGTLAPDESVVYSEATGWIRLNAAGTPTGSNLAAQGNELGAPVTATSNLTGRSVFLTGSDVVPVDFATKTYRAYAPAIANHATSTYQYIGHDDVDNLVFVNDQTGGLLRQGSTTTDWATQGAVTFTASKGWPPGVTHTDVKRILRFKDKLYILAKDTGDNITKVWRTSPTPGNTAFSWEGPQIQYTTTLSKGIQTALTADGEYIYLGEYGDPPGGPTAWRSGDGVNWTVMRSADAALRHIHAIEADPFNPGHLWMTVGDGVAYPVKRSTDYGNTWRDVTTIKSLWQAVQISFTANYVYLAGDDSQQGVCYVIDRDDEIAKWASFGLLKNIPVPAPSALTDAWYGNAYFGIVYKDTGVFYSSSSDSSGGGNVAGLFATTGFGQTPQLLDKFTSFQAPVYIFGGMLWVGKYRRPLL